MFPHGLGDYASGGDQGLLVRQRHYLSGFERGERGPQAAESDHRAHDDVDRRLAHEIAEAFYARPDLDSVRLQGVGHLVVAGFVTYHHVRGIEFERLAHKKVDAASCRDELHLEHLGMPPYHVERLRPDRAGGAEYCYSSFLHFRN